MRVCFTSLPPRQPIDELVERFGLGPHLDSLADSLPMGLRQRLSLAVAVLHGPKLLILDEPTSGVDPVARDSFWELLSDLSRKEGVTIFVTTHFMNEGMRCNRISLMHAGKVLACDAPQKLIDERGAANLEDAFIGYMEDAIARRGRRRSQDDGRCRAHPLSRSPRRLRKSTRRQSRCRCAGCSPIRATRRSRSSAIRFAWRSPSSARRC